MQRELLTQFNYVSEVLFGVKQVVKEIDMAYYNGKIMEAMGGIIITYSKDVL